MGKSKEEEKQKGYDLFCNTTLTQKECATVVGVSPQQFGKWVKDGNWELYRNAQKTTLPALIQGYYQQLAAINKEVRDEYNNVPTTTHQDGIIKIANAIEKLNKKFNLSSYHRILREFLEFELKRDAGNAKLFAPAMLEFLNDKAKTLQE